MAVAIRLARHGSKKRPYYRVVAAEKSSPRDGRFIELLGTYDPRAKQVTLKQERYEYWLSCGAKASPTVASLARRLAREADGAVTAESVSAKGKEKKAAPAPKPSPKVEAEAKAEATAAPAEAAAGDAGQTDGEPASQPDGQPDGGSEG